MSEKAKTGIFVGVAVVVLAVAWVTRPKPFTVDLSQQVGKLLNEGDPLEAASLEIVKFDEETGETKPFKVAEVNGVWALPSHLNYPADAENQLADVAASVLHLEVLNVFDIQPADYSLYGVVDPTKAHAGDTGVGMRVTVEKADGSKMADFIIGKEDPKKSENRFIRLPDQDVVYVVPLDTSKLSTRFQDWIEDDLLKLNAFDIRQVVLNNYSFDEVNGRILQGDILDLKYDDKEAKWTLADLKSGEELDTEKLNEMKRALDDLKIIDVRRKPEGLSRELRSEEGIRLDQQAMVSLAQHGFYLTRDGQLISNEGEVVVRMNDGVEYILRFGEIAVTDEEESEDEQTSSDGDQADKDNEEAGEEKAGDKASNDGKNSDSTSEEQNTKDSKKGSSRYIFVMARFNPDLIPKPELEPLPDAADQTEKQKKDGEPASADSEANDASAEKDAPADSGAPTDQSETQSTTESEEAGADSEGNNAPENSGSGNTASGDNGSAESNDPPAGEQNEDASTPSAAEASSDDSGSKAGAENGNANGENAGKKEEADAGEAKADGAKDEGDAKDKDDEAEKERKRIERENQRKMDEYNEKVKKAQDRVKELNDRFADWYYIISNSVYEKIHLSRADIIKKSEAGDKEKPQEGSLEELETIKEKGLGNGAN